MYRVVLDGLKDDCETLAQQVGALKVLRVVVKNLIQHPEEEKYQRVKLVAKVDFPHAVALLTDELGFQPSQDPAAAKLLELPSGKCAKDGAQLQELYECLEARLVSARKELEAEVRDQAVTTQAATVEFSHITDEEKQQQLQAKQMQENRKPVKSMFDVEEDDEKQVDPSKDDKLKPLPEPTFDIEVVGLALRHDQFPDSTDDQYRSALQMLEKICRNILKKQDEPKYRSLNFGNAKLQDRVGRWPGAVKLLEFVGFVRDKDKSGKMVLSRVDSETVRKLDRAAAIIKRTIPDKVDKPVPVDRDLQVFNMAAASSATSPSSAVLEQQPHTQQKKHTPDMALILAAYKKEQDKLRMQQRFTTREQREEQRLKHVPMYSKTCIRILFENERLIVQGYFHPLDPLQTLFDFVTDCLRDKSLEYTLRMPPQTVLHNPNSERTGTNTKKPYLFSSPKVPTLKEHGLVPAGTLRFSCPKATCEVLADSILALRKDEVAKVDLSAHRPKEEQRSSPEEGKEKEHAKADPKKRPAETEEEIERRMMARMARFASGKGKSSSKKKTTSSGASSGTTSKKPKSKSKRRGFDIRSALGNRARTTNATPNSNNMEDAGDK